MNSIVRSLASIPLLATLLACSTYQPGQSATTPFLAQSYDWNELHDLPQPVAEELSHLVIEKVVDENLYTVNRGLREYEDYFGPAFSARLARLNRGNHWIDGGAGNAFAQKDFLGSRDGHIVLPGKPRLTAITVKYPENEPKELDHGRFRVLAGRYFEDIPLKEIAKADLITDVVGILNYTAQLDLALAKYLSLLKDSGKIYVMIPTGITYIRRGKSLLSLQKWLRDIPGISVSEIKSPTSPYPSEFTFTIEKTGCGIAVPHLKLTAALHNNVVIREFTEEEGYFTVE